MALPAPEETLMGVTQYNPRKKQKPVVPLRVERREPPKVLNKPGTTEWVGTQKPTEQQKPEKPMPLDVDKYEWKLANPNMSAEDKAKEAEGLKALQKEKEARGEKFGLTEIAEYRKQQYLQSLAKYNQSVKTYNQAIGHKTPAENKAIAERLLKKTQPKTVMA